MKKLFLFFMIFSFFQNCGNAQRPSIEGRGYRVMLKTLLSHTVPEIGVADAAAQLNEAAFLDTRSADEFEVSRITGAQFADYDTFSLEDVENIPKDQPVIVYCSVGYRSEKISEQLLAAGYETVYNLYGGIFEWKNQGQEVVDADGKTTEQVHAFDKIWGVWLKEGEKVY